MSTMSTTGLYEEDLHGTNPANLITNEVQTLQVPGAEDYYFIIPKAAPYFADSLKVFNAQTGTQYVENVDYLVGHYFIEAMNSIGRPICGSIRFMKRTIQGQVRLTYRTIGGQWGFSDTAILAELSNRQLNPLTRSWAQIDVLPALFPPLEHSQPVNSLIGSKQIIISLDNLAAVIEAQAEGASQSHLTDFNNPHRVTAVQLQLGNVPNYGMATDTEARAGIRTDALMSPRGVFLQITDKAIAPLNAHINATGNVHRLVAADINLGNVPNFPAATPAQAVDITNNAALMTPYTVSLLINASSNLERLDELENLIRNHIGDTNNPHKLTPAILGVYTKQEIDKKIQDIVGGTGGDAATFGGKTPDQWAEEFVSVVEAESLIDKVKAQHEANTIAVSSAAIAPDYTPGQVAEYQRSLIGAVVAGYVTYSVSNARNSFRLISGSTAPVIPDLIYQGQDAWAAVKDAVYVVSANGAIKAYGTAAIQPPAGWKDDASFNAANACEAVYATKDKVWIRKRSTPGAGPTDPSVLSDMYSYTATGTQPVIAVTAAVGPWATISSSQAKYVGENTIIEINNSKLKAYGDVKWVDEITRAITEVETTLGADVIRDVAIGDDYVLFAGEDAGDVFVYQINRSGNTIINITKVVDPVFFKPGGARIPLVTKAGRAVLTGTKALSGTYSHFVMTLADGSLAFFGDNLEGQCEVDAAAGPFLSAAAGLNFTVTVNTLHQTLFWGNSPDNSMLYGRRGITIIRPEDAV